MCAAEDLQALNRWIDRALRAEHELRRVSDERDAYAVPVSLAAELFQSGKYAHALHVGQSCLVDGLRWLDATVTAQAHRIAELEAELARLRHVRILVDDDTVTVIHLAPEAQS